MNSQAIQPTPEILKALQLALSLQVIEQLEREKYSPIKQSIFNKYTFVSEYTNEKITNTEELYESTDEAKVTQFYNELHNAYIAAGANLTDVGYCPMLIAESNTRTANRLFAELCFDYLSKSTTALNGVTYEQLLYSIDEYKKFVELQKRYFCQFLNKDEDDNTSIFDYPY